MKTIELSNQESRRWTNDAAYRREVREREEARAKRLNEAVEVYLMGRHLFTVSAMEA